MLSRDVHVEAKTSTERSTAFSINCSSDERVVVRVLNRESATSRFEKRCNHVTLNLLAPVGASLPSRNDMFKEVQAEAGEDASRRRSGIPIRARNSRWPLGDCDQALPFLLPAPIVTEPCLMMKFAPDGPAILSST